MDSQSSDTPCKCGALVLSVVISVAGILIGVATHFTIVSFHDTGLLLALLLVSIGLLVGEIVAFRYQAWGGALMLPVAIALGLFLFGDV